MGYNPEYFHATRVGSPLMTVVDAEAVLADVERKRTWVEAKPTDIIFEEDLLCVRGRTIGHVSSRVISSAKRHTGVKEKEFNDEPLHDRRMAAKRFHLANDITLALWNGEYKNDFMFRVNDKGYVTGMVTTRYVHMPFDKLLASVPKNWVVPRMQIDAEYCDVHACHPDRAGDSLFGIRMTTSDVGLMRATMFLEMLVLVCSNGMVSTKEIEAIKQWHLGGWAGENVLEEWNTKLLSLIDSHKDNFLITKRALTEAAHVEITEDGARNALLRLGVGPVRIKNALDYAYRSFPPPLTKFSVAQGLTHESQVKALRSRGIASVRQGLESDLIATQFLVS